MRSKPEVCVVMGSDSDWPWVKETARVLGELGVECEVRVISAHRSPLEAAKYAVGAETRSLKAIVASAGGAAHLAGVMAAHATLPVDGMPMSGASLNGLEALLSTVQMPAGTPVARLTLGTAGPVNAAFQAAQIAAISRRELRRKLERGKLGLATKVADADTRVQAEFRQWNADLQ